MIQIQKYFNAEKSESLLFMAFGLFFMLFSIYCFAILKEIFGMDWLFLYYFFQ